MMNRVTRMIVGFSAGMVAACMTGFAAIADNMAEQKGPELSYELSPSVRKFLISKRTRQNAASNLAVTAKALAPNAKPTAN